MKKLSLIHYLVALAVLLAMIVIGLILLLLPGPIRTVLEPATPSPSPTPTGIPTPTTTPIPVELMATMAGGEVPRPVGVPNCESFDLGRRSVVRDGTIRIWPGEWRGSDCYAVPPDTEVTIMWEYATLERDADVVRFFLNIGGNSNSEAIGGDTGVAARNTYSITTTFPADMPPSFLQVRGYDNGTSALGRQVMLFIDKIAPTPTAPECQGFWLDLGTSTALGKLTISPSKQHGRRCYSVPADTEITLAWEDRSFGPDSVYFNLNPTVAFDRLYAEYGADNSFSVTTTLPASMPPSQLWVEMWADDYGMETTPIIIFIER